MDNLVERHLLYKYVSNWLLSQHLGTHYANASWTFGVALSFEVGRDLQEAQDEKDVIEARYGKQRDHTWGTLEMVKDIAKKKNSSFGLDRLEEGRTGLLTTRMVIK